MILKVQPTLRILDKILRVKTSYIFEGSACLYNDTNKLYITCYNDSKTYGIESLISSSYRGEPLNILLDIKKFYSVLKACGSEDIDIKIDLQKECVKTEGKINATIMLFDSHSSYETIGGIDKGSEIHSCSFLSEKDLSLISTYIPFVSLSADQYDYVFVKDTIVVTNMRALRKSKSTFNFPYTFGINSDILKLLKGMEEASCTFYEHGILLEKDETKVYFNRILEHDVKYNNLKSFSLDPQTEFSFSFDRIAFTSLVSDLKVFIPTENNKIVLDIENNKFIVSNPKDIIDANLQFDKNGGYSIKALNGEFISKLIGLCGERVSVKSKLGSNEKLFIENDLEYIGLAPIKVD